MKRFMVVALSSLFLLSGLAIGTQKAHAQSSALDAVNTQNAFIFSSNTKTSEEALRVKAQFDQMDLLYSLTAQDLPPADIDSESMRVMWWNIDCGTGASKITGQKTYKSNLEKNILDMIQSDVRPNVLILGEYCPYYISPEFSRTVLSKYKHSYHLVRNIPEFRTSSGKINERNGILVLSDYSLSKVIEEPLYADTKAKAKSRNDRSYLLLKVKSQIHEFYLNPLHIFNPWRSFLSEHGMFATFFEIEGGTQNPNAQQGQQVLEKNMTYTASSDSLLIIGDFNSPKSFYAIDGYVYKLLSSNYESLILDKADTFVSSGMFQSSAIDHAFAQNMSASYGRVLPLAGSGHLPIYVIIK